MDQELLNRLLENTYTNRSLIRRTRYIKDFVAFRLFDLTEPKRHSLSLKDQLEEYLLTRSSSLLATQTLEEDRAWLLSLGDEFFNRFAPDTLSALFKELDQKLSQLELVVIYLAVQLPELEENRLGGWFKKNLGQRVLLEIRFDPSLIGGCALSYRGVYKDFSLRDRLSQNRKLIFNSLQSFQNA